MYERNNRNIKNNIKEIVNETEIVRYIFHHIKVNMYNNVYCISVVFGTCLLCIY